MNHITEATQAVESQEEPIEAAEVAEVTEAMTMQESLDDAVSDVRAKIIHLLEVFPYISRAMIQTGLSPALPPKLWDPVLQQLVTEKVVQYIEVTTTTPGGRVLTKGIYHLPKFPYPVITVEEYERIISEPAALDH